MSLSSNRDLQCDQGSDPAVEATVQSANTDPKGTNNVTIVEADCYPDKPASNKIVDGSIPCTGGPDATLTLGKQFTATKTAASPGASTGTHQAQAATIHPYNLPEVTADNSTLKTVFQIIFGIIGAFAVLSITASGFKYITAAGDPQRTSEAKKGIAYALVGLAIAISAEAIVTFLISYGG